MDNQQVPVTIAAALNWPYAGSDELTQATASQPAQLAGLAGKVPVAVDEFAADLLLVTTSGLLKH
jgi:hypothetical protein